MRALIAAVVCAALIVRLRRRNRWFLLRVFSPATTVVTYEPAAQIPGRKQTTSAAVACRYPGIS